MNKLFYKLICLMILVSFVTSQFPLPTEAASYSAKVTADILNVRSKATTNSSIKFKLKQGTTVTVTKEKNEWSYITYGKKNGWVSSKYLSYKTWTGYSTASIDIRKSASSKATSLIKVNKGVNLTVKDQSGSWLKVYYASKKITGWVLASQVSTKKQATTTSNLGTNYVTASSLNVRQKATTSSKVITTVKKNTAVTLLKKSGSWGQVNLSNGKIGWVSTKYLTNKKPTTSSNLGTYYVTTSSLNVRQKATTSSKVITSVKKNTAVTLLKKSGSWGQVKLSNGKTGWVSTKYLTNKKPTTSSSNLSTYYVTASNLNVRQKATTSSKVITSVKKNTAVTLLKKSGSWGQVKLSNGKTGWVSMKYLTTKKPETNLGTYYVTANTLAVKEKASASAKTIVTLKQNEALTLQSKSGDWGKVKTSSGKIGWVPLKNISTKKVVNSPASTEYVYITEKATVYKDANTDSSVLTSVSTGTKVQQLSTKDGFTQIKLTSGMIGWVSSSLLTTKTVKGKTIVIDAGHGGNDPGAIGTVLKTKEKDINLSTANQLAALLRNAGATVIMTRTTDVYQTLSTRVSISNKNNADAFISIHYNAANASSARGIETFYYANSSLASALQQEIVKITGLNNRGIKKKGFTVLYENNQPAALVELGFLTNATEEKTVSKTSYHKKAAQGILNGLNVFFSK